jgi:hypothetical protein
VFAVSPIKVVLLCQPLAGIAVDVLIAYSAVCPLLPETVTVFTVMLFCVGVPFTVGTLTSVPKPMSTALAVTSPEIDTALVATVTLDVGIVTGSVITLVFVARVVGVPVIGTVTTVELVRTAAPAVNPDGRFDTVKCELVIEFAYVLLCRVNTILPVTA